MKRGGPLHILLYFIAVFSALAGIAVIYFAGNLEVMSSALLAAVLFGAIARIVHTLDMIEGHLRAIRNGDPTENGRR